MSERFTHHHTFVIERNYPASAARVFNAFADPAVKGRWFVGPDEWTRSGHELDFWVGGRERVVSRPPGGPAHVFEGRYHDIIQDERIVFAYDMYLDEKLISVSLTTVELTLAGTGTRLLFTEQATFLDGHDDPARREQGTRALLDNLGAELRRAAGRS
jgi:uncharacterized protein YndB with AHSA1/START domain